ncbi:MAG TPA: sensor histidine kinase [Candidatus Acidoferrales bacterium]|nr:sensor histidine kinase [Candidatus Acidoferrales bacterium]
MTEEGGKLLDTLTPQDAAFHAVDTAVSRERARLARDLHDGFASELAAAVALFRYYFESNNRGTPESEQSLRNIYGILEEMLKHVRGILSDMRPRRLGPSSLVEELRHTAEEFGRLYSIRVELWISGNEEDLTPTQREVVYHIVREALTNVRRHSESGVCRVRLAFAAKPFLIEVTDEGKGFETGGTTGYGLVGMRERAAGIGGRLEIVSTPAKGTTVFLFGPELRGV